MQNKMIIHKYETCQINKSQKQPKKNTVILLIKKKSHEEGMDIRRKKEQ